MVLHVYRNKQNVLSLIAEISTIILLLIFVCIYALRIKISLNSLSLMVLINSVGMFVLVFTNKTIYHSGSLIMFFLYNLIVNNGFVIAMFINKEYSTFQSITSMAFLQNEYYHEAIVIANIVLSAFSLSLLFSKKEGMDFSNIEVKSDDVGSVPANIIGIALVGVATLYTAYTVFANGLWMAGYLSTLQALEGTGYNHFVVIASLGIAFLVSAGTKKGVHIGIFVFCIYSLLQFSMGNRGEVFYPAVICFALYSLRFKTIGYWKILMAAAVGIVLIPLVRISRELKIDGYMFNPINSILDVLAEEGIEINPFTYIVQYVHSGTGHVWGMTYVNDFTDFIFRRIGASSPFAIEKNVIKDIMPYSGMAFSMIAETYYNFTVIGSIIVYVIMGQYIREYDRKLYSNSINKIPKIIGSMLLVELINLTRNDASTLPIYIMYEIIIICLYVFLESLLKSGKREFD